MVNAENRFRYDEPLQATHRKAVDVISFEIEELGNTDIITYIYENYAKDNKEKILNTIPPKEITAYKNAFRLMEKINKNPNELMECEFNTERFVKTMLSIIKLVTNTEVKYALWLASKPAVTKLYSHSNPDINEYEMSDIILSDLGYDGTLFGYTTEPEQINKKTEYKLLGYDKDHDVYVPLGKNHNLKNLIAIGEALKERLKDDTLVHTLPNGRSEPIDWLEIYEIGDPSNKKLWTSYETYP